MWVSYEMAANVITRQIGAVALQALTLLQVAEIVGRCQPMGDLGRFAIDDLTAAEEDEFFATFEDV